MSGDFEARWDRLEANYLARLQAACRPYEDWRGRLRAALLESAALAEAHPAQARFLVVDPLAAGEPERRRQQRLLAHLAARLDRVREQLEDPGAAPAATADWLLGAFFDRVYRHLADGRAGELRAQVPQLTFLAVSAYFGAEAGLAELRAPRT